MRTFCLQTLVVTRFLRKHSRMVLDDCSEPLLPAPASASKKHLAKNQDFRCDNEMARQGEIRKGEIPPFEDDAPRQDAPHIPEGSQQDRPAEGEGSHSERSRISL